MTMAVLHGARFPIAFDELFPQGAITWVVRATGLRTMDTPTTGRGSAKSAGGEAGKSAA